ncbi:uncharacterized protein LOC133310299 [Gastrolobium bilobum]|uniref:uncharacterized protein LOC133310299 n=1 Tax=Gastrolobium bilobum TaxID=150636 RepID=UPI002AB0F213|nr:uncharacterized protein LOC133310299 [Gastrolobium bilobum]
MEASKKNEIVIKKAKDHWAFLEDIEAPMWADLTLEAKFGGGDIRDDDWFNISHPFHQWSARQLKCKFSHPGEEILTSGVDSQVLASPELPSSVSRSRGKHYNSKTWEGINLNTLLDKQQGLSRRCFQPGSSFGQEVKPKSKSNVSRPKGLLSAKLGLAFEHNARGKAKSIEQKGLSRRCFQPGSSFGQEVKPKSKSNVSKPKRLLSAKLGLAFEHNARGKAKSIASCSNPVSSSSSVDNKTGESTTGSTVTSENILQQQKYREVSSQPCGQKRRSSSVRSVSLGKSCLTTEASRVQRQQKYMEVSSQSCDQKSRSSSPSSVSLRKSYITGKASKVEIGGDSMQSRGRKSSSGKSSVGSSCSNPGYEVKFLSKKLREKITDEKDVVKMNLADKNRCKPSNISKTSTISVEGAKSGNRKGSSINFAKPAYHGTVKSLSIRSRALLPIKVNKENSCAGAKEKLGTSKVNSLTVKGKENATTNVTRNQKCIDRGAPAAGMLKNYKTTERKRLQKGDTAGSAALTILVL